MAQEGALEAWTVKQIHAKRGATRKVKWLCRIGAPDRLVWIPGWLFPELWEMKGEGLPLKEHQKREHKRLKRMGVICRKVDTREKVERYLR